MRTLVHQRVPDAQRALCAGCWRLCACLFMWLQCQLEGQSAIAVLGGQPGCARGVRTQACTHAVPEGGDAGATQHAGASFRAACCGQLELGGWWPPGLGEWPPFRQLAVQACAWAVGAQHGAAGALRAVRAGRAAGGAPTIGLQGGWGGGRIARPAAPGHDYT